MMPPPRQDIQLNSSAHERLPLVKASGFREYDARWLIGSEINTLGFRALGLGVGTLLQVRGVRPLIVAGHDYRSYSLDVKNALVTGLLDSGCTVYDVGFAITPIAYFAQSDLRDDPSTSVFWQSPNPNGCGTRITCASFSGPLLGPELTSIRIKSRGQGQSLTVDRQVNRARPSLRELSVTKVSDGSWRRIRTIDFSG